jgi:hypothetical protein
MIVREREKKKMGITQVMIVLQIIDYFKHGEI